MADTNFYKYLEASFRHKVYKNTAAASFNYLGYNLPYETSGAKKGIFEYARKFLPKFYTSEFPDTKEGNLQMARKVLEKLDRRQDLQLNKYFDQATVPIETEYEQLIAEAKQQSQQAPTQQPAAAAGVFPGGIPAVPSVSFGARAPRIIYNAPQVSKPDIVIANKSGVVVEAPPSKIFIANKSGIVTGVRDIKPPSFLKTFGSNTQIFIKKNLGKVAGGLANMAKGVGRGIIGPGLGATANILGRMGNGGLNALERISQPGGLGGGGIGKLSKSSNKFALAFIGILLFMVLLGGLMGGLGGTSPTGEAAPIPPGTIPGGAGCPDTSTNTNGFSCRYLNPSINVFDANISQTAIDTYVNNYSSIFVNAGKGDLNEFKRRVNYIVEKSKQGKLNPAIFLGYWKTESLFSTLGARDMGCIGDNFEEQVQCALAIETYSDPEKNPVANCTRSNDANSSACQALKNVRAASAYDTAHPINYPIRTFDDFAESYGPYGHLTNGQPTNCISTYNKLIEVAKELNACTASPGAVPPPAGGDYKTWIKDNFNIDTGDLNPTEIGWAKEILDLSQTIAPKFRPLISAKSTVIKYGSKSHTDNQSGITYLKQGYDPAIFKLVFIHELSHRIKGLAGNPAPACATGLDIIKAYLADGKYLTSYAANATSDPAKNCVPGGSDPDTKLDEDFAETIAYYINKPIYKSELNYGENCGTYGTVNPYDRNNTMTHKSYAECLLGP